MIRTRDVSLKSVLGCALALGLAAPLASAQAGTETVLYSFTGGSDGAFPMCGLIMDKKGNLYGTANGGGAKGAGAAFEVTPKGVETVLYSFAGGSDGSFPEGGVITDKAGNLYGTTSSGGTSNDGAVFMVTP